MKERLIATLRALHQWPAFYFVVLLLGGIQLIALGIIGEYVGRIYDEVKGRPLYLVRARRNMVDPDPLVDAVSPRVGEALTDAAQTAPSRD